MKRRGEGTNRNTLDYNNACIKSFTKAYYTQRLIPRVWHTTRVLVPQDRSRFHSAHGLWYASGNSNGIRGERPPLVSHIAELRNGAHSHRSSIREPCRCVCIRHIRQQRLLRQVHKIHVDSCSENRVDPPHQPVRK